MLPLDTYKKNRRNYVIPRKDDDKVFAYHRTFIDRNIACTRKWWNTPLFYRRMYRELSYDFKHAKIDLK